MSVNVGEAIAMQLANNVHVVDVAREDDALAGKLAKSPVERAVVVGAPSDQQLLRRAGLQERFRNEIRIVLRYEAARDEIIVVALQPKPVDELGAPRGFHVRPISDHRCLLREALEIKPAHRLGVGYERIAETNRRVSRR